MMISCGKCGAGKCGAGATAREKLTSGNDVLRKDSDL
jgi:uncharacterized low-complexity protein